MTIPVPATMETTRVVWDLGWTQTDTTGTETDLTGARGSVLFEPTAVAVNYPDKTVLPRPVETRVSGGVMAQVYLPRNDPDLWNWRVTPKVGVAWEPFHIDLDGDSITLATAAVVPGKGPIRAVKGEKGDPGKDGASTWADITGKPTSYPSTVADVTGLDARLAALEQDTRDRNITSLVPEANAGHWTVRRIGKWVYMNLYDLDLDATSGDYWQQTGFLPVGFRPPAASQYVHFTCAQRTNRFTPGPFRVDRYGGVTVYGVTGKLVAVTVSWPTNDPFPTTLPGVPA